VNARARCSWTVWGVASLTLLAACATNAPTAPPPAAAPAAHASAPAAVEPPRHTHELLDAVLWVQTAVEHDLACRQAFALAAERVERALKDPKWTALPDQTVDYEKLQPAVVFDADETIVDNSEYEAALIEEDRGYDSPLFDEWAAKGRAKAIPGAVEFTKLLKEKGVETIVITNREEKLQVATLRNLVELGFPMKADGSTLLSRTKDMPDKASRRSFVAKSYRVLLLLGDDLGDFTTPVDTTVEDRRKLADTYRDYWGWKWIVLPNPMYGSWERALYPSSAKDERERLRLKYEKLRTFRKER
jgi:5'-nucleotidase (lipoprotein e(P4) family)